MNGKLPLDAPGEGGDGNTPRISPRIGDRLRHARERRNLTIADASADLKIRIPILIAFEREDHSELPPRIYALGQLRTYATYLGLEPNTVVAGWQSDPTTVDRSGTGLDPTSQSTADRVLGLRWDLVHSTRGVLAVGGLGISVLAISAFMVLQLLRFVLPPAISITSPADAISTLGAGTLTYEIAGTADPRASVVIETSAGAQLTTEADESGLWSLLVPLGTGRTEVVAHAVEPGTGVESSTSAARVFVVALPDKIAPEITVSQPTPNFAVENGDVPISVQTAPSIDIAITATDTAGELVTTSITSDERGVAKGSVALPSGRWTLSFSVPGSDGTLGQATRTVDVRYTGVTVSVTGGAVSTWIRVWIDGLTEPTIGVFGKTLAPGARLLFTGAKRIEIRSADPSALSLTLNGRTISKIKPGNGAETYAFLSNGKVQKSSRR